MVERRSELKNTSICSDGVVKVTQTELFRLNEILEKAHQTPDLGNIVDPLDELLYLLITQRTRINLAQRVYRSLKSEFSPWEKVLVPGNEDKLKSILSEGGRGNLRYRAITELLSEIRERAGELSLEFLRGYSFQDAKEFLLALPWVGEKIAYCVLMYSLGYPVFPADSNVIRVFRRTGILDPVSVGLEGIDHRISQKKIAPHVPGDIAYPLHVNMVTHGKEICLERSPKCNICPIRPFCQFHYKGKRKEAEKFRFTLIDLFCGAGGISYGFARAGIRPVLAVDNHEPSCDTYRQNVPWIDQERVLNRDITEIGNEEIQHLVGDQPIDIIVAGVPCQGFSKVGLTSKPLLKKRRPPEKEAINRLFMEVTRWTEVLRPSIVLLENVPTMGKSKIYFEDSNVGVRELLEKKFRELGYSSTAIYLNSADFGIPQVRKRLFFVAWQGEVLHEDFDRDLEEFWNQMNDGKISDNNLSLDVALLGLPVIRAEEGSNIGIVAENYPAGRNLRFSYQEFVYDNPYMVFNHAARYHNEDDMLIISSLQNGETYKKLVSRKPEVIMKRKNKVYSLDNFHDKFYRLNPSRPCRTIVSHLAKDGNSFIHPYQDRAITVREAARIQSFPDSFIFEGSRTAQFIQVGNAVPPFLAMALGTYFSQKLEGVIR